ncbi:hypothetical protein C4D60_Mb08t09020 [Musa balbisiana]|uniref:Uncharacterized protein n=1 Tax=Musa balbisiana TaxID=52838 RepID=A0A4S8K2H2_MUSBA|nr:hypothetical protein C4D60_Mb08t09020 [Musa balbisiana]
MGKPQGGSAIRANRLMKAIKGSRASRVWRAREVVESRGDEVAGVSAPGERQDEGGEDGGGSYRKEDERWRERQRTGGDSAKEGGDFDGTETDRQSPDGQAVRKTEEYVEVYPVTKVKEEVMREIR